MIAEALWDEAVKAIDDADEVALVCHVNPDPDAMGSMLGLACFLAERGTRVVAAWPNDPTEPPRWLEALPGREHLVAPRDLPKQPKLLITLDAAAANRLDGLIHLLDRAPTIICIDHHRTNPGFGTINLIDGEAAATAQLVFQLIERMGGGFGPDTAANLYAGLITDTGRFQFEATSPEVLRIAAALREQPFDHARLAQALYEDNSLAYLRLLGAVLDRAALVEEAGLVWTHLSKADLEGAGVSIQDTDDLIDVIRTARESDVSAVLKEQRDGGWKVSMRSRGATNVAEVAEVFGGGGHRLAAGYSSDGSLDETVKALTERLTAARASRAS
ncbi:MAG TPA: bifunctional oligoribonuclease/PAP phosphatase NrnA [Actinomycetota bacterium]